MKWHWTLDFRLENDFDIRLWTFDRDRAGELLLRILFMGTPEFAAESLQQLIFSGVQVIGVVTQPDKPKGRGLELQPSEVKSLALANHLPVWQPEAIASPEFLKVFQELRPDLVVVVAFGQKIPAEILFGSPYGCINVHGSLLPKYRGAAPIQWSILNGDTVTGITTMYMDEGWDTGDIIHQSTLAIDPDENLASLYSRLAKLGGELLVKTVADIAAGVAPRIPQDPALATTAPKLKPELQKLHWNDPAARIHNLVRVFAPAPGMETILHQERLKIIETDRNHLPYRNSGTPGEIIALVKNRGIVVSTGDVPILISKVQPVGKRVMSGSEFSNGRRLETGMHFEMNV
jgi:methionyl-tRNA formyltransferase